MRNPDKPKSMRPPLLWAITVVIAFWAASGAAFAQQLPNGAFAAQAARQYRVAPDITYSTANNYDSKLDVYRNADAASPRPTLVYFHGGGWVIGSKEQSVLALLPYLEAGWNAVNVEYRLGRVSPAPGAVEDGFCALRWTMQNAKQYNIDVNRIVLSGNSAGGHLALTTGIIPESAGLDRGCTPTAEEQRSDPFRRAPLKVAAIINWYGISDVADLLEGAHMRGYAVNWFGSMENRIEVARRVSPINYIRPDLPPVISIQANADPTVPYEQNVRLHAALDKAGVPNQLVTVVGNTHGNYKPAEYPRIYAAINEFLVKQKVIAPDGNPIGREN